MMFSTKSFFRRRSTLLLLLTLAISVLILGFLSLYVQLKYAANVHLDRRKKIESTSGIDILEPNDAEQASNVTDLKDMELGHHQCQMESCFNYNICQVFTEISHKLLVCENYRENKLLRKALKSQKGRVNRTELACLTVVILSRCKNNMPLIDKHFSTMNETKNFNHLILLNCPESSDWKSTMIALKKIPNVERAIVVSPFATTSGFNKGYDIVSTFLEQRPTTGRAAVSALKRNIFVNFDETCLQYQSRSIYLIRTELEQHYKQVVTVSGNSVCDNNCKKCDSDKKYALQNSVFTVISLPMDKEVLSTLQLQKKLFQILQYGSIPVVIGTRFLAPFEEIIDWSQILVRIPEPYIMHLPKILTSYPPAVQESMRHKGGLVFNQHLRTLNRVITATLAVIRTRLNFAGIYYMAAKATEQHKLISLAELKANVTVSSHIPTRSSWFVPEPSFRGVTPLWDQSSFQRYKSSSAQEKFTIVIPTSNRTAELSKMLVHLNGLRRVDKIIVVWNSQIPENITWWPQNLTIPIHAIQMDKNNLNNRFFPFEAIETDAVLSLDDDIHLDHKDLLLGFRVWRENQNRLVGYLGRRPLTKDGKNWVYYAEHDCPASIILTSCAFVHKMYLVYYTFQMPDSIRRTVDRLMNCEDIAMNFLVSHLSQKPPLKITDQRSLDCSNCSVAHNSLSKLPLHSKKRSFCVTEFSKAYGYTPLFNTYIIFKNESLDVLPGCTR